MVKLPPSVIIFGKTYPLIITKSSENIHAWIEDDKIYLNINAISSKNTDNEIISTLAHEMGHALFRRIGLIQSINPKLEEIVVDNFAKMFVECFEMKFRMKAIEPLS